MWNRNESNKNKDNKDNGSNKEAADLLQRALNLLIVISNNVTKQDEDDKAGLKTLNQLLGLPKLSIQNKLTAISKFIDSSIGKKILEKSPTGISQGLKNQIIIAKEKKFIILKEDDGVVYRPPSPPPK